jgi:hypothetical protein
MGQSLLGYRLDYPKFGSKQEPDIFLFSKMHNQPPIQLKLGASTGSKAVAT